MGLTQAQEKETQSMPEPKMTGVLSTGKAWQIVKSRRASPGLEEGEHLVLVLVEDTLRICDVSLLEWAELSAIAHNFAAFRTAPKGNYRIAYNGPGVGKRDSVHLHIIIPEGDDVLPPIVRRGDTVV